MRKAATAGETMRCLPAGDTADSSPRSVWRWNPCYLDSIEFIENNDSQIWFLAALEKEPAPPETFARALSEKLSFVHVSSFLKDT